MHWTDEVHVDRGMAIQQYIFREEGYYDGLIVEQPPQGKLVIHIATSVSWYHKSLLVFYNDSHWTYESLIAVHNKNKPRRRPKSETDEQYQQRLIHW